MALGADYSPNVSTNKKNYYEPEVRSALVLSNSEGVDPSALSIGFFRDCLKFTVSPLLPNPTETKKWDTDHSLIIYINHTKARILLQIIDDVLCGKIENGGINSGAKGFISFSNGKELGINSPCLIFREIDPSTGSITSTYAYEFKMNYHYAIVNFDANTMEHSKTYFDNLEIEQFKDLLKEYYTAVLNATSYTVVNQMRFDTSRMNTKINSICEALGIKFDRNGSNYNNKGNNRSYFDSEGNRTSHDASNNSYQAQSREATIDSLGDEDDE